MNENLNVVDKRMTTGRWVLLATSLAGSMALMERSAANAVLPALQVDLGATGAQLALQQKAGRPGDAAVPAVVPAAFEDAVPAAAYQRRPGLDRCCSCLGDDMGWGSGG